MKLIDLDNLYGKKDKSKFRKANWWNKNLDKLEEVRKARLYLIQ